MRRLACYWLPVLLWMGLMFGASGNVGSSQHTSRIIGPIVRWLFPALSDATVDSVVLAVRKTAHVTEYAILTWWIWRALRRPVRRDPRPWEWRSGWLAVAGACLYAISDEVHQTFVPSRMGSVLDVLLDSAGALGGLLTLRAWCSWRRGLGPAQSPRDPAARPRAQTGSEPKPEP